MERREFVTALGAAAVAGVALAKEAQADVPGHSHPSPKPSAFMPSPPISRELQAVVDATLHCLQAGETCLAHCNELLGSGDTMLAACQRAAMNMLAVCGGMFKAASYHSADPRNLKALARACADFCRACAAACEPHTGHHAECKACFESCSACSKACDAYAVA